MHSTPGLALAGPLPSGAVRRPVGPSPGAPRHLFFEKKTHPLNYGDSIQGGGGGIHNERVSPHGHPPPLIILSSHCHCPSPKQI
jgi:hypothetical protein